MCGRFTLSTPVAILSGAFPWLEVPDQLPARYNIAPTQEVAAVLNDGLNKLEFLKWGLVPSWAGDPAIGNRMINARAETLASKPSFRAAYRARRCLVLADGFYEWREERGGGGKTPFRIQLKSDRPFAMAGLWETWHRGEPDEIRSCAIVTTDANDLVGEIHDRMPVILRPEDCLRWIDPERRDPAEFDSMLAAYPASEMIAHEVSKFVNSPRNDSADCVAPIAGVSEPDLWGKSG